MSVMYKFECDYCGAVWNEHTYYIPETIVCKKLGCFSEDVKVSKHQIIEDIFGYNYKEPSSKKKRDKL